MSKIPFYSKEDIYAKVLDFVSTISEYYDIPVDIEFIIENLGIEIVPQVGCRDAGFDAFITRDFQTIVVDADQYNDDKFYNRVKFSMAHELGHLILHKEFFENNANSTEEWYEFMSKLTDKEYQLLEFHANVFAGALLVPCQEFVDMVNDGATANALSRHFKVSQHVIRHRIEGDDVYPLLNK